MILHPALRFLIATRWKNRARSWLRRLKTPLGLLGGIVIALAVTGIVLGSGMRSTTPIAERQAMLSSFLGFLIILGVLGGIGQRGLIFSRADLDFLFPAPIPRRHLLAYHFIPQYLAAVMLAGVYLLLMGGRSMPAPIPLFVAIVLCQMTSGHLSAFAAELSMKLADRVYGRLRRVVIGLVVVLTIGAVLTVVLSLGEAGQVGGNLRGAWDSPWLRVALYPAVAAAEVGAASSFADAWIPLTGLVLCTAGSFLLVTLLNVDFMESSYTATTKMRKRMADAKRGLRTANVKRSVGVPRSALYRGAGAVLWLNLLIMRRQLRALLGGVIVIVVMFSMFSARSSADPTTFLTVLTMVPIWMTLPVGFRLPRDQLMLVRQLPVRPTALVAALVTVPTLMPFLLQVLGIVALVSVGSLALSTGLAALPAFLVVGGTLVAVEGLFLLRQADPSSVNVLQTMGRLFAQFLALLPGIVTLIAVGSATGEKSWSVLIATAVQFVVACFLMGWIGRRFQRKEIRLSEA